MKKITRIEEYDNMEEIFTKIYQEYPLLQVFYKGLLKRKSTIFGENSGIKVLEQDWDNLIILDACRYDFFEKINWLDGEIKKVTSRGSHTSEWLKNNFSNADCSDIVCVGANPHYSKSRLKEIIGRDPFHHVENVWDYGWSEKWGNVPPEKVTDSAIKTRKKYRNKRLIIHYNQPHQPFPPDSKLSKNSIESLEVEPRDWNWLCSLSSLFLENFEGVSKKLEERKNEMKKGERKPWFWDYASEGLIPKSDLIEEYSKNIQRVLSEVEELLEVLSGKNVITADHGNLLGEHGLYGHPPGLRLKELIEVPWLKISEN